MSRDTQREKTCRYCGQLHSDRQRASECCSDDTEREKGLGTRRKNYKRTIRDKRKRHRRDKGDRHYEE